MYRYLRLATLLVVSVLVCTFTASAQTNSCGMDYLNYSQNPGPCNFGVVSTVPVTDSYIFNNGTQDSFAFVSGATASGPFSVQWPKSLVDLRYTYIPVKFSPSVRGTYNATLSATYKDVGPYFLWQTITVTFTVSAQWK